MAGQLIIICAPSGAGKTTIIRYLLKQNLNLEFSVSATSRNKRKTEMEGKDYYFLSVKEFQRKIENNDFIEWEEVYDQVFYGTLKSEISRITEKNKHVIFDVDVYGAVNIKKLYPDQSVLIFIMPPSIKTLRERLERRSSENQMFIEKRIRKANKEIDYYKKNIEYFDYMIVNDQLDTAEEKALKIIKKHIIS